MVRPWQGRHHVHGIFSLPKQYRPDHLYTARLIILGVTEDFPDISLESESEDGSNAEMGHI